MGGGGVGVGIEVWIFLANFSFLLQILHNTVDSIAIINTLHRKLLWGNLNLDLCLSRARAFASGGILKDKRENN